MAEPMTKPTAVPADGSQRGGAGPERVGPQHGQRAEDDPEPMRHVGDLDHGDRQGQAGGAPNGVAEPDRVEGEMREARDGRTYAA